mmetsp:Transcript_20074/g.50798  ORF Transcript_20074/g.50798 Transcript_20074/m.50798 type:complete len:233 (+) Transcript_20074:595-1293(+)
MDGAEAALARRADRGDFGRDRRGELPHVAIRKVRRVHPEVGGGRHGVEHGYGARRSAVRADGDGEVLRVEREAVQLEAREEIALDALDELQIIPRDRHLALLGLDRPSIGEGDLVEVPPSGGAEGRDSVRVEGEAVVLLDEVLVIGAAGDAQDQEEPRAERLRDLVDGREVSHVRTDDLKGARQRRRHRARSLSGGKALAPLRGARVRLELGAHGHQQQALEHELHLAEHLL